MSTSASAYLFYGYDLGDEEILAPGGHEVEEFDFENWLCSEFGGIGDWPENGTDEEQSKYFETKEKFQEAFKVEMGHRGMGDTLSSYLYVAQRGSDAWEVVSISPDALTDPPEEHKRNLNSVLQRMIEQKMIDAEEISKAGWYLTALYW